jgi:hypothetical protein
MHRKILATTSFATLVVCLLSVSSSYAELRLIRGVNDMIEITDPQYTQWKNGRLGTLVDRCVRIGTETDDCGTDRERCACIDETGTGDDQPKDRRAVTFARAMQLCPTANLFDPFVGTWRQTGGCSSVLTLTATGTGSHKSQCGVLDEATWGNCNVDQTHFHVMTCDYNAIWKDSSPKELRYHGKVIVTKLCVNKIRMEWDVDTRPGQVVANPPGSEAGSGVMNSGSRVLTR